ncbi:MAG TPA: hypothetical protein VGH81_09540 [Rudaea sp.]|jgi:hypothetical protein
MTIFRGLLLSCGFVFAAGIALAAAPFDGKYVANGKDGKLAYLSAKKGEPFSGRPVTILIFSEKDASKDARADFHAQMGDLGDALVVHLSKGDDEWRVIGTEFAHSALKHSGASGSGIVSAKDVSLANGEISGHLVTEPNADLFDEPLTVDLKFRVRQP